ncbi:MAG: amidohydrolase [Sphingomonadaceae bacterium]|nr:amidohydrolase [Sphingomonadaceae bacterium]
MSLDAIFDANIWQDAADGEFDVMVDLRRAIHREPELGLSNPKTRDKIRAALADLPIQWREGPSTTGLIGVLEGAAGGNGRTILLRGDMDALPMHEETGLPYASTIDGAMHACGHDSHVAMLAGAAKILCANRDRLAGRILFMFQPGEEGHHGARHMLDDGLIDPLPDAAFALHISPNAPHGLFTGRAGALLASTDKVQIRVSGKGGHASMPHDAIDPVPIACAIVGAIQQMVTRQVPVFDPCVVTIGKIAAGTTDNVIPEFADMLGTIRTLSPERRADVQARITTIAEHIALAHGASASTQFTEGFPVTLCDSRAVAFGARVIADMFGENAFVHMPAPMMGGEDFSYVLNKVPGAMFFLGASHEGDDWRHCCGLHSNHMVMDEKIMARGAAIHAAFAERFLAEGWGD